MEDNYIRKATILYAADGDTIDCEIKESFKNKTTQRLRLIIVNTPEKGNPGYQEAKDFTTQFLGKEVMIQTFKDTSDAGWGRYLAYVEVEYEGKKVSLHELLLAKNLGVPYKRKN